jgi:hypothetical protein
MLNRGIVHVEQRYPIYNLFFSYIYKKKQIISETPRTLNMLEVKYSHKTFTIGMYSIVKSYDFMIDQDFVAFLVIFYIRHPFH